MLVFRIFGVRILTIFSLKECKKILYSLYDNLCVFYSGGGLYDEKGDGVKQGNWMEIFDGLNYTSKVMY